MTEHGAPGVTFPSSQQPPGTNPRLGHSPEMRQDRGRPPDDALRAQDLDVRVCQPYEDISVTILPLERPPDITTPPTWPQLALARPRGVSPHQAHLPDFPLIPASPTPASIPSGIHPGRPPGLRQPVGQLHQPPLRSLEDSYHAAQPRQPLTHLLRPPEAPTDPARPPSDHAPCPHGDALPTDRPPDVTSPQARPLISHQLPAGPYLPPGDDVSLRARPPGDMSLTARPPAWPPDTSASPTRPQYPSPCPTGCTLPASSPTGCLSPPPPSTSLCPSLTSASPEWPRDKSGGFSLTPVNQSLWPFVPSTVDPPPAQALDLQLVAPVHDILHPDGTGQPPPLHDAKERPPPLPGDGKGNLRCWSVPGSCDEPANEDGVSKPAARWHWWRLSPQLMPPWQLQSAVIGPHNPDQLMLLSRSILMVRTLSDTIKSSDLKQEAHFNLIV